MPVALLSLLTRNMQMNRFKRKKPAIAGFFSINVGVELNCD